MGVCASDVLGDRDPTTGSHGGEEARNRHEPAKPSHPALSYPVEVPLAAWQGPIQRDIDYDP